MGSIDLAHAAGADPRVDAIRADRAAGQLVCRAIHPRGGCSLERGIGPIAGRSRWPGRTVQWVHGEVQILTHHSPRTTNHEPRTTVPALTVVSLVRRRTSREEPPSWCLDCGRRAVRRLECRTRRPV